MNGIGYDDVFAARNRDDNSPGKTTKQTKAVRDFMIVCGLRCGGGKKIRHDHAGKITRATALSRHTNTQTQHTHQTRSDVWKGGLSVWVYNEENKRIINEAYGSFSPLYFYWITLFFQIEGSPSIFVWRNPKNNENKWFLNSNSFQLEEKEKIFSKYERRRAGHGQVIIFNWLHR